MPSAASARAKSTRPVLSETDNSARRGRVEAADTLMLGKCSKGAGSLTSALVGSRRVDLVLPQLFAQRRAIQAQQFGRARLIAVAVTQGRAQQWRFDLLENHLVEIFRRVAVERCEIVVETIGDRMAQRFDVGFLDGRHARAGLRRAVIVL